MSVVNSLEDYDKNSKAKIVANTAKGRISKWVLQENKARQIFWKTNISCLLVHTGGKKCYFSENLAHFVFL